jgi:hypothetical protein
MRSNGGSSDRDDFAGRKRGRNCFRKSFRPHFPLKTESPVVFLVEADCTNCYFFFGGVFFLASPGLSQTLAPLAKTPSHQDNCRIVRIPSTGMDKVTGAILGFVHAQ